MLKSKKLRVLLALVIIIGALWFALRPKPRNNVAGTPGEPPYLTYFMIDGLDAASFEKERAAGRLPNISKMIAEGYYAPRAVGAFPSMTAYGFYPFLTGEDAVNSGALGLRWFDRSREQGNFRSYVGKTHVLLNQDLAAEPPSVFERFGEQHSFTLNSYNNRGAHWAENTGWMFTMAKYKDFWWVAGLLSSIPWLNDEVAPDWLEVENRVLDRALADLERQPKVQWITFVSPDTYSHTYGLGPRYPELLRHIDHLIGKYRARSAELGQEKNRVYAVVTDHGVEEVSKNIDLSETLTEAGVPTHRGFATYLWTDAVDEGPADFTDRDAFLVINGNLMNYLYLRKGWNGFESRLTAKDLMPYRTRHGEDLDIVQHLLREPGVELVALLGDTGTVEVHRRGGKGFIQATDSGISYTIEGKDPLHHPELADGKMRTAPQWLAATSSSAYPYGVVRLHRLVSHPDCGDLVITASKGYDLAKDYELFVDNYRGGHGGLRAAQIQVPYVLAGPGVKAGGRDFAITVEDFGQTVLHTMGVPTASTAEGKALKNALSEVSK